ncbi:MAG TPA: hypothetical protein VK645_04570 [Chitinophagaceae bacterium]|nr:hypothetical protein [Chitinophagaceae bacterium]
MAEELQVQYSMAGMHCILLHFIIPERSRFHVANFFTGKIRDA